ncbi:replication initiator protein [robinz microvirus RP_94]|nr:replication initiator protein [robinz microvirus RP_94]
MRCLHEAKSSRHNCFITLTYSPDNVPLQGLRYRDFQLFSKRARKALGPFRFYMCGEYGEHLTHPHYHACLFGVDFPDRVHWSTGPSGFKLYRSSELERLWPSGFSSVGDVTFESAGYVARYCVQKRLGDDAARYYGALTHPFNHMSLKPGIGQAFLDRFLGDIYPNDFVVVNGRPVKPPKFYDQKFREFHEESFEEIRFARECRARERYLDNTDARLLVKEEVQRARVRSLSRGNVNDFEAGLHV